MAELEAELVQPPLPTGLEYIWRTYWRLRKRKGGSGFGASPLEWPDFDAFIRVSSMELAPWEIEFIELIDDLYMAEQVKKASKAPESGGG